MSAKNERRSPRIRGTFQRAVFRGLAVVLPPLLTLVIVVWLFSTLQTYVLQPVETASKVVIGWVINDTKTSIPPATLPVRSEETNRLEFTTEDGTTYVQVSKSEWIPKSVYDAVVDRTGETELRTAKDYYRRYIEISYLNRFLVGPFFFFLFVLTLYFLGRSLAYGVGRMFHVAVERIITQLPFIRTVYGSVKQVTDFVFSDTELEFNRVVAVEYPRRGIWSLGFVTGESMLSIREAANEPVVSILIPTSPMPATGYTITVRKSETIELDITIDQAFQFIVSCGVVVPISQLQDFETNEIRDVIESQTNPPAQAGA